MSQAKIDALIAESQECGRQIDALREQRRGINEKIKALQAELVIADALKSNPALRDAIAPGAVVDVSAADVIKAMARGL